MGWGSERDVRAAVRFLQQRPDVEPRPYRWPRAVVGGGCSCRPPGRTMGYAPVVLEEGAAMRTVSEFLEIDSASRWLTRPARCSPRRSPLRSLANQMPPAAHSWSLVAGEHVPVCFIFRPTRQGRQVLSQRLLPAPANRGPKNQSGRPTAAMSTASAPRSRPPASAPCRRLPRRQAPLPSPPTPVVDPSASSPTRSPCLRPEDLRRRRMAVAYTVYERTSSAHGYRRSWSP